MFLRHEVTTWSTSIDPKLNKRAHGEGFSFLLMAPTGLGSCSTPFAARNAKYTIAYFLQRSLCSERNFGTPFAAHTFQRDIHYRNLRSAYKLFPHTFCIESYLITPAGAPQWTLPAHAQAQNDFVPSMVWECSKNVLHLRKSGPHFKRIVRHFKVHCWILEPS